MTNNFSNNSANNPIGVFDSGVGGTSIWKEIHELLPNENTIYLADSKNAPYGIKNKEDIIKLCEKNTEILLNKNCKLIVVACNTATTNAIKHLRTKYPVPFIGIEPAIKPASLKSKTKSIGILATKGTLTSELFSETVSLHTKGVKVIEQEGTGIVELIESGKLDTQEMKDLLSRYLDSMITAKIDHLVLGCSHYPFLIPTLLKILPEGVSIIDSGLAVAKQTKSVLESNQIINLFYENPSNLFFTNGNGNTLRKLIGDEYSIEELNF